MTLVPVVLSGGSGSRLWPLSRELYPKQFLSLGGAGAMLQETVERLQGLSAEQPVVICNEEHRFVVAELLARMGTPGRIVLEPCGRNTAPAAAIAALDVAAKHGPHAVVVLLPADHMVRDAAALRAALATGVEAAQQGRLVTLGIVPTRAETAYGYIHRGAPMPAADGAGAYAVQAFAEKPDPARAQAYLESGEYLWNSGVFLFQAETFLEEMARWAPDILDACRKAHAEAKEDADFVRLARAPFTACRAESVDYAVMEKTDRAVVVPLDAGWSDIGSWDALHAYGVPDAAGNVIAGDVICQDTGNCYVRSEKRLVATVGLHDHIVVETADAVLVAHRDQAQGVKALVERLKLLKRPEALNHSRVARPWGTYETITLAGRYQVKHIIVKPGAALSLQMHHHRAEHWVVVQGTARVTCGDKTFLLSEDESTYVPLGTRHRLENPGMLPLEMIEVQTGSYLGEDDIVRFDDVYGRQQANTAEDKARP